ncbi:MAG: hypothetical protein [Dermacentor reticulatus rhabdovirus 1]|uniref:Uncharacterized protein n=1 Tax=Dermacentor reticulatus rhabdovirus 1 TaxID=2950732 RepID=A0AAE9LUI3_9RHAB|nr:MAG: hypothetical protein [Dermacentor reticulatus rhabdovirus 1]
MSKSRRELPVFQDEGLPEGDALDDACRLQGELESIQDVIGNRGGPDDAPQSVNVADAFRDLPFANVPAAFSVEAAAEAIAKYAQSTLPNTPDVKKQGADSNKDKQTKETTPVDSEDEDLDSRPCFSVPMEEKHRIPEDLIMISTYFSKFVQHLIDQEVFASGEVIIKDKEISVQYRVAPNIVFQGTEPSQPPQVKVTVEHPSPSIDFSKVKMPGPKEPSDSILPGPSKKPAVKFPLFPTPPIGSSSKLSVEVPAAVGSQQVNAAGGSLDSLIQTRFTFDRKGGGTVSTELGRLGITSEMILEALAKKGMDVADFFKRPIANQAWICLGLSSKGRLLKASSFPPSNP